MKDEDRNDVSCPHVSVVIPTTGKRQNLLARAINSADAPGYDVEVIVVVNGNDASAFQLPGLNFNGVVRVIRLESSGVSNARNCGLDAAKGLLVRFLDDDDYLLPEFAVKQYALALESGASIVSGRIKILDESGACYGVSPQIGESDPYCDLLSASMVVLPLAHVYKASSIKCLRWDVRKNNAEDVDWLHRMARDQEQAWRAIDEIVGVWYQHSDINRLSYVFVNNEATKVSAEAILETNKVLRESGRTNLLRESAAALGLWRCAHKAFYLSPIYWTKIKKISMMLDKQIVNQFPLYRELSLFGITPIFIDWLMIPKRFLNNCWRIVTWRALRVAHVRRF